MKRKLSSEGTEWHSETHRDVRVSLQFGPGRCYSWVQVYLNLRRAQRRWKPPLLVRILWAADTRKPQLKGALKVSPEIDLFQVRYSRAPLSLYNFLASAHFVCWLHQQACGNTYFQVFHPDMKYLEQDYLSSCFFFMNKPRNFF